MAPDKPTATTPVLILIVEDSAVQAFALRHILEGQGYQPYVVGNGRDALKMAAQIRPTLVISDVNMPEMTGYELCRQIKASPDLHETPVILVTSLSDPNDVLLGLQCGADSFVIKPYDKSHMLARVQHALTSRSKQTTADDGPAVDIFFHGERHQITASRAQILNLLISTYDATVERNKELHESRELLRERTAQLSEANHFLDSMIEHIPNPVYILDAAGFRYVRINRAAETLTGISRDEMLGKSPYQVFGKTDADVLVDQYRRVMENGTIHDIPEHRLTSRTKGERLIHTRKVPMLGEGLEVTHILGISEDVTEQKAQEREIFKLNSILKLRAQELEAANKSLESFTSAASHDLRSPLSVISGYAGLLEKNYARLLDEKGQRYLSVIRASTKSMAKLIDDLMAFSRLGLREIHKTSVDVQGLVEQVMAETLRFHPEGKKPTVKLGLLPPAKGDAALLRQVWVNLLSNAVKYSSRAPSPLIEISGRTDGAETVYSVRDNGAGFSMVHYDKLFEVFQRLHTDKEFEGAGVGLPIVHRVVTRHGGRVWAEGKVGQGAVFHFALPV